MKNKATVSGQQKKDRFRQLLLLAGIIVIVTFICYSPVLRNGFTNWDDNAYVFNNPHLGKPISKAVSYFFGPHYFIGNYIPLTMTVYALEFHKAGLDPYLYHLVNLWLHIANILLVFWLAYLLSSKKPVVAGFVAFFFALHPMHVESVAWVAELKDVLYTLFFISGMIVYLRYVDALAAGKSTTGWRFKALALVFIFFILSVLSKPAAIVFPLAMLLLDFYRNRRIDKKVWLEKLVFFATSVVFGLVAVQAQAADRLLHDYYPLHQRFFFASHSIVRYLIKALFPSGLSIFHPYPMQPQQSLPTEYYLAPLLVAALAYFVYKSLKQGRLMAFGALFFLVNILLVLQFVSIGEAIMAERYTYVSYIGLFFLAGIKFDSMINASGTSRGRYRLLAIGAVTLLALTFCYITYERCKVWNNNDSLANDLLEKYPGDRLALNNKGFLLFEQGKYEEAIPFFKRAVAIRPDYTMAYINLVDAYLSLNRFDEAMLTVDEILKREPSNYNVLNRKGYILQQKQAFREAIAVFNEVLRYNKDNVYAFMHLAECYYGVKEFDNGIRSLDQALALEPNNHVLLNNKGYLLFSKGLYKEAVDYFNASLRIKPDYSTASANLANCYRVMKEAGSVK
jgi:tetratricopeptide (TPR) repeat protein